jgi:hypothetical protein
MEFQGMVKPRRRGGWIARGVVVEQRSGQRFETQVGPREFADGPASIAWLTEAAVLLGIGKPAIATLTLIGR